MSLAFDPIRHEYRFAGKVIPGVTRVLEEVVNWSAVPPDQLEHARRLGTAVHTLCQAEDEEGVDPWQIQPEMAGYLDAYRKFRRQCLPRWEGIEERVFHKVHRYAGTLDRRGWISILGTGDEYAWIDIKTGADHPAYDLQLSAYVEASAHKAKTEPCRYALLLRDNGEYKLSKRKTKHRDDFAVFLSLLTASRWKEFNHV